MRAKRNTPPSFRRPRRNGSSRRPFRREPDARAAAGGKIYMYGRHALAEALQNAPQVVRKVFLSPDLHDAELSSLLKQQAIAPSVLAPGRGTDLVGKEATHQGVIAMIDPTKLLLTFDEFLNGLDMTTNPSIAVLGEVQDPHNVGAIIRSAAAFGLSGILIPEHRQAPITGAVVKTSAGMAFRIPLVTIGNVNGALAALKKKGFWTYGLAMDGTKSAESEPFEVPAAFVIGNEGAGIREKTLAACDVTLKIPMHPRTESLNAAVSAAVVFYEWSKKHPEAL